MADPFASTEQPKPVQPPWWTLDIPAAQNWWMRGQLKPKYGVSDQGAFSKDWKGLTTLNPGYKDVLAIMTESGAQSPFWKTALKAQTGEGLSLEDNALIEKVWRILAEESAMMQEKAQEQKWYTSQNWSPDPTVRALEVSQFGKDEQEALNRASEARYEAKKFDPNQPQDIVKTRQERLADYQKELEEQEKKRVALKGPREWMRYVSEIGETPSWLGYWFSKKGAANG